VRNQTTAVLLPEIEAWRSGSDIALFQDTTDEDRLRLCPVTAAIIRGHMGKTRRSGAR
jgi:hypothetical protein